MLSEISQRKTKTTWYHSYVESKKYNKRVNVKEADSQIQRTNQSFAAQGYKAAVFIWENANFNCIWENANFPIVQHGKYSQYFVIAVNGV